MIFMLNPLALLATAVPILPRPMMPRVFPCMSVPRSIFGCHPVLLFSHSPLLTNLSASTTRLATAKISAHVKSAVASVRTSGVFVT